MNDLNAYVQAAQQGDTQAYEVLYKETYYIVYYTCFNLLKNEQDALDVTQDVYVTVMNQFASLMDTTKFIPWLNRIAVNKCMDFKKKNRPVAMEPEAMEQSAFFEENENFLPEAYIQNQEKRELVLTIMRTSLSEKEYETIFLYYFSGLSVKEIAEAMECPEGTVTYRLSVARGKIKNGVLSYEKTSGDKLYSFAAVPFLASLFAMEVQEVYGISVSAIGMQAVAQVAGTQAGMQAAGTQAAGTQAGMQAAGTQAGTQAAGVQAASAIGKAGGTIMKKKIIAGIVAGVLVVGGVTAAIVVNQKDKKETTTEVEYDYAYEYDDYTEEETTEAEWETDTEETETEATTEEASTASELDLIEFKETYDGMDEISGSIQDIAYTNGFNTAVIILTDNGHLYSCYAEGSGYTIVDFGETALTSLDNISYDIISDSGELMVIDGNQYYYAEAEGGTVVNVVDSYMLEGKTVRTVGLLDHYVKGFYLYGEDGSYYDVAINDDGNRVGTVIDSQNYLVDTTEPGVTYIPAGVEIAQRQWEILLGTDGKLYYHRAGSTLMEQEAIEATKDYNVTKLYPAHLYGEPVVLALTDTNEILILEESNDIVSVAYTITAPDSGILNLWYNRGYVIVKTADGYYSCDPEIDTTLVEDEIWNSLTLEVVEMQAKYVLLEDGYVYEFPED